MKTLTGWLAAIKRRAVTCPALPGARFERPAGWAETDKENLDQFLKTASGAKILLTLHALVTDRALSVCDRTPYEHGITGGMSFLLGEIERLAVGASQRSDMPLSQTAFALLDTVLAANLTHAMK